MSQFDEKSKIIDGTEYRIRYLPPREVLKYSVRLSKLLLPAIGEGLNGAKSIESALEGELSLGSAMAVLADRLDEQLLQDLTTVLSRVTSYGVDNRWPELSSTIDVQFLGKPDVMFEWLFFALEVNFSPFLSMLKSKLSFMKKEEEEKEPTGS